MKTMITEFVNFKVLETTTDEQLIAKADAFIGDFMKKQDGFVDAELTKAADGDARCFILRYESFEKVKPIVEQLGNCQEFAEFKSLLVPGSIAVTFNPQLKTW
jgi:hypothetical protein